MPGSEGALGIMIKKQFESCICVDSGKMQKKKKEEKKFKSAIRLGKKLT